jgi:hypothetical protein
LNHLADEHGSKIAAFRMVLLPIHEYVHETMPHFTWRPKRPRMVSIGPNGSAPREYAVDGTRDPNLHSHEPARESGLVRGFHQQMNMIGLHRKVRDPEPSPRRARDCAFDFEKDRLPAQTDQAPHDP